MTLLLRESDVQALLTMPDTVACVESAMKAHGLMQARNMPRERIKLPRGTLHILGAGGAGNITPWYLPNTVNMTNATLYFDDGSGFRLGLILRGLRCSEPGA